MFIGHLRYEPVCVRALKLLRELVADGGLPGQDKADFFTFDFCQNLEFFSPDPATVDGSLVSSLGERLFEARVKLVAALDKLGIAPLAVSVDADRFRAKARQYLQAHLDHVALQKMRGNRQLTLAT